jgi:hypothetical protein
MRLHVRQSLLLVAVPQENGADEEPGVERGGNHAGHGTRGNTILAARDPPGNAAAEQQTAYKGGRAEQQQLIGGRGQLAHERRIVGGDVDKCQRQQTQRGPE